MLFCYRRKKQQTSQSLHDVLHHFVFEVSSCCFQRVCENLPSRFAFLWLSEMRGMLCLFPASPLQLNKQAISSSLAHQKQVYEQLVYEWRKHGSVQNVNNDVTGLKKASSLPVDCTESGCGNRMKGNAGNKTLGTSTLYGL